MNNATLTIMIGLPRSGKSTYVNTHKGDAVVVSADQLRKIVYGQDFWNDGEEMVWAIRKMILRMLCEQQVNIFVDETNTTINRRQSIIDIAKKYNYVVNGIYVNTTKEICMDRTDNIALTKAITDMSAKFQVPTKSEGFNELIDITGKPLL